MVRGGRKTNRNEKETGSAKREKGSTCVGCAIIASQHDLHCGGVKFWDSR